MGRRGGVDGSGGRGERLEVVVDMLHVCRELLGGFDLLFVGHVVAVGRHDRLAEDHRERGIPVHSLTTVVFAVGTERKEPIGSDHLEHDDRNLAFDRHFGHALSPRVFLATRLAVAGATGESAEQITVAQDIESVLLGTSGLLGVAADGNVPHQTRQDGGVRRTETEQLVHGQKRPDTVTPGLCQSAHDGNRIQRRTMSAGENDAAGQRDVFLALHMDTDALPLSQHDEDSEQEPGGDSGAETHACGPSPRFLGCVFACQCKLLR